MSKIAIVGATGLVGSTFLKVIDEYKVQIDELRLFASSRSKGNIINFLKIRGSYGILGNDRIADYRFVSLLNGEGTYVFNDEKQPFCLSFYLLFQFLTVLGEQNTLNVEDCQAHYYQMLDYVLMQSLL